MKKLIAFILCLTLVCSFSGCSDHSGEAKTPSASSVLSGSNYNDVVTIFKDKGFTNIELETIDDLITGWLTKEGEVEEVSVGGDVDYSPDKWVPADTQVVIRYHVFPSEPTEEATDAPTEALLETESQDTTVETESVVATEGDTTVVEPETTTATVAPTPAVLTKDNCAEFADILSNDCDYTDIERFAVKYKGKEISFKGRIDYCDLNEDYNTRFDYLVSYGDYNPDTQIGPSFKFENVNYYDLHTDIPEVTVGLNVLIVAKIEYFDSNTGLFYLDPVSISAR